MEVGRTAAARVVDTAVLARIGRKGAGTAAPLSVRDRKLRLMHIRSKGHLLPACDRRDYTV